MEFYRPNLVFRPICTQISLQYYANWLLKYYLHLQLLKQKIKNLSDMFCAVVSGAYRSSFF